MNKKGKLVIIASFLTLSICVGIALQAGSPAAFGFANSSEYSVWHHYNKKLPTQNEKGIKEYWVECGGGYQFFAPTNGIIIDKGSNYDTSEFSEDDNRWLTYCDEYGHSLDSYNVCSFCGELNGSEMASETAISGSDKINNINPVKGFKNVYYKSNISRGTKVGVSGSISSFSSIYFALMQNSISTLYVYGGDGNYASLAQNTWTYFLLKRDSTTNKFSLFVSTNLNGSWTSKKLDDADQSATNFNFLRFYSWDYSEYSVYCSEIYTLDISSDLTPCSHSYDSHDICLNCMKHKTAVQVADFAVTGSTISNLESPLGFENSYQVTGKSSGQMGVNIDISNVDVIYFALYTENGSVRPFSGGDDGDGTHRIIWSGRWYYILVEKINGAWNGFVRESGTEDWYTRTVDGSTDTNFSSLLRLYNWDNMSSVIIHSTEVYCASSIPQPVEKSQAINIGVWNGSYHFTSTSSIDDLVNAGFNTTIGINPLWNSNWNNVLDYSATRGVKHIVDPRGWDSANGRYAEWDGSVPSYVNHSAVEGFMMWDEPNTTKYSQIAQMKDTFDSVMPSDKKFFVNLLSSAAGLSSLYGTNSATSSYTYYENNYAKAFHNTVNPDIYSYDSYPIFTNGEIRKSYFCTFDIWSNMSRMNGVPTWYSLLSSAHKSGDGAGYEYGLPTQAQLEWQMSVAISFGMTNLMHYIYATDEEGYSCMANVDGSKNEYYYTVAAANNNIHALNDDLVNYGWEGAITYHNLSKTNLLFKELKHTLQASQVGINSINATSDCLLGSYVNESGDRAYMITNSGYSTDYSSTWANKYRDYNANVAYVNQANNVSLTVDDTIIGADIIQNGVKTRVSANNNTITVNLAAYGNAFVIPVK